MKKLFLLSASILIILFFVNNKIVLSQWSQSTGIFADTILSLASTGNTVYAGTSNHGVFVSPNNGISWSQTSLNNRSIKSIFINGGYIFAGTDSYGIYYSTNSGTTWLQTSLINKTIYSLAANSSRIFAGTSGEGVYSSTNNGTTWIQSSLNNQDIKALVAIGNNIIAGSYSNNGIYFSTNNGANWMQSSFNNRNVLSFAVSGTSIYAGTYNYGVNLSTNSGINWNNISLNAKVIWSLITSGNNVVAGCNGISQGVYLTTNNGTDWFQKNQGFDTIPTINALTISGNYILAGTNGFSIWRRLFSEIIGITNISTEIPSEYNLYQNYPNPFNPTTKIKFDIPAHLSFPNASIGNLYVSLKVYDILGKEIQTLVNELLQPGTYEVTFDGSNLPTGIYFYKLISKDFIETRKMLLLK